MLAKVPHYVPAVGATTKLLKSRAKFRGAKFETNFGSRVKAQWFGEGGGEERGQLAHLFREKEEEEGNSHSSKRTRQKAADGHKTVWN